MITTATGNVHNYDPAAGSASQSLSAEYELSAFSNGNLDDCNG